MQNMMSQMTKTQLTLLISSITLTLQKTHTHSHDPKQGLKPSLVGM